MHKKGLGKYFTKIDKSEAFDQNTQAIVNMNLKEESKSKSDSSDKKDMAKIPSSNKREESKILETRETDKSLLSVGKRTSKKPSEKKSGSKTRKKKSDIVIDPA